jgi:hypothetical protein
MDNIENMQANMPPTGVHQATKSSSHQPMDMLNVTPIVEVEPRFIEHLMMYKGKRIIVCTTVEKMEGILDEVAVDHLTLKINDRIHHVRYGQIVYFA